MSTDSGYSAAQRLFDEAVDQAVREEHPIGVQWRTEQEPKVRPAVHPAVHVLDLGGTSIKVEARSPGRWWVTLIHGATIEAADESVAKRVAIDTARQWLTEALAACPDTKPVHCWVCLDTGKLPTHGNGNMPCPHCQRPAVVMIPQPSVTAATSAALVGDYKEVLP